MKIDRHNYEEYFVLYVDNELGVDEKRQVDLFVKENPDLEEELVMLQQSKLIPEESVVFEGKHLLMKEENNSSINLANYEEWLVLYVDDELNEQDKLSVEKFVAGHPQVQQELALFQQTRLEPEEVVFTNKNVLYRTEKPRVIIMQWWKVAVAAVLILAAGVTTYSVLHKTNNNPTEKVAVNKDQIRKEEKTTPVDPTESVNGNNGNKEQVAVAIPQERKNEDNTKSKSGHKKSSASQLLASNNQHTDGITDRRPGVVNAITAGTRIEQPQINDAVTIGDKMLKENFSTPTVTNNPPQTPEPMYASNTDNSDNKRLRGFFRKATRLIEHTTKINPADDDNRVLIGGMAINLK